MRACAAAAVLVFAACGPAGAPAVEIARSTDVTAAPSCRFDFAAPEPLDGELWANDAPGLDCVPPDGGATFQVGFAHGPWRLVVTLPRARHHVGDTVPLDGDAAALLYQSADRWCADWIGVVVWRGELPDWRIDVDAWCTTTLAHVAGTLGGHAR